MSRRVLPKVNPMGDYLSHPKEDIIKEPRCAFLIKEFPRSLRRRFKAACSIRNVTMTAQLMKLLYDWTASVEEVANQTPENDKEEIEERMSRLNEDMRRKRKIEQRKARSDSDSDSD